MTDRKTPLARALDLFVYAPLGLLLNAEEVVPQLVERGKQQIAMARMIGPFAVQQGQVMAGQQVAKVQEQAAGVVGQLEALVPGLGRPARTAPASVAPAPPPPPAPAPAPAAAPAAPAPASASASAAAPVRPPAKAPAKAPARTPAAPRTPASGELAIPDYDSLSASQVVPRLAGLSARERRAVQAYETAHRGRKTILSKLAQLG